jgi:ATP-binding cassette subfamily B protein
LRERGASRAVTSDVAADVAPGVGYDLVMARLTDPLPKDAPRVPAARAGRLLWRSFAFARPEWRRLAAGTACLLAGSASSLAFPQAIRMVVDSAGMVGAGRSMDRAAAFMLVLGVTSAAAASGRYILFTLAGERVVARLRAEAYAKLLGQEIAFFDTHKTGDLSSTLASDTTAVQSAVSVNLSMLLRNAVAAAGGVGMLLFTSWRLALLMLTVVPPIAVGAVAYGRRVRRLSRDVQDAVGAAAAIGEEGLGGIRTVRSFAAEGAEAVRYGDAVMKTYGIARKRTLVTGVFLGVAGASALGAIALVMWSGGRFVQEGRLTVGALTSFLVYTMLVAVSLGALGELWADFLRAAGAAERIFAITDRVPAMRTSGGVVPTEVEGRVELSHVDFAYPARPDARVLADVSLVAAPGDVLALVGPSGAGKSTIAALLARLYDPTAGVVCLDGSDVRELDPTWLRRQVGVVAQEPLLFASSVAENIRYGRPGASDEEVITAARAANAHEFVARFRDGYATLVGERGVQLSGGQKQRIAIARAVLKDPRVLILDEATSALDAESEHLVHEALDRLQAGRTTFVIAHRLSTVKNASRVLVIDGGRVVQEGTHDALVGEAGLYRRLVERQFVAA